MTWKCHNCKLILEDEHLINNTCPKCGKNVVLMCINDTPDCNHEITSGIKVCNICGEFVCPICGCHDVTPVSRITGYLSPVSAWNNAKKQELKDRVHYEVL